jgi:iron complex transport system substrate-binding protein
MAEYGSVYEIDAELLRSLNPDLILAQAVCEVCAVPTSLAVTVSQTLAGAPRILSLDSHTVTDILDSVVRVGEAVGDRRRGEEAASRLRRRLDAVAARVGDSMRPKVMAVEWLDPPFVPGHWTPEMITLAGGVDLFGSPALPSRQLTWEALEGADPDILVVMPCGYGLSQARADADRYTDRLVSIAPRAIESGRAWVVDGSAYFNRSGPRMATGVEILGAILHPELFLEYDLTGKAEIWAKKAPAVFSIR